MAHRLEELARHAGAELRGDPDCLIDRVDTLEDAAQGAICFLADPRYRPRLAATRASAVILAEADSAACPVNALVCADPHLAYARVARVVHPEPSPRPGIHPSAVVAEGASIDPDASVGPCAVIDAGARVGPGVVVGPGCYVGEGAELGEGTRLVANVTVCHGCRLGRRVLVHPGAVIGSDGFGLARTGEGAWEKVPQLGRVVLGDDVEVGANTTIDRGALRDTVIAKGVKLDNQIQVAHNVRIGAHTAVAGCAGIAGSTVIGEHCTVAGGVGIAGHLEIADNVHFSGASVVTRSFKEPGQYSGNLPAVPTAEWRRAVARIRRLDEMAKRLQALEQRINEQGAAAAEASKAK